MPSSAASGPTISMNPPETTATMKPSRLRVRTRVRAPGVRTHLGADLLEDALVQPGQDAHALAQRLGEVQLPPHRSLGDLGDLLGSRRTCAASSSMTSCWIRVESTSMTTRRRPRRSRPPAETAMSTPCAAASQCELAAQPEDVGAGDVELDGGDGVAGQPPDAVDVGAVRGDPGGHRGDRAGDQRSADDDDRRAAAASRRVVAGAATGLDLEVERVGDPLDDLLQPVGPGPGGEEHGQGQLARGRPPVPGPAPRLRPRRSRRRGRWSHRAGRPRRW